MSEPAEQEELFELNTNWFVQFVHLFTSGKVAEMGATAFTVLSCVKAYASFKNGKAFPSIETIVKNTGISRRQVITCLQTLEEKGYLTKEKLWRKSVYTIREQMEFTDKKGHPVAVASFDFIPALVRESVAELKRFKVTGDATGMNIINIDKLVIENINIVQGDQVNINVAELDAIKTDSLREKLRQLADKLRDEKSTD